MPCWPSAASSIECRAPTKAASILLSKAEDIKVLIRPNRVTADDPFYTTFAKRSIYLPIVRNMLPDVFALFDAADPNGVTAAAQRDDRRIASAVSAE